MQRRRSLDGSSLFRGSSASGPINTRSASLSQSGNHGTRSRRTAKEKPRPSMRSMFNRGQTKNVDDEQ